MKHRGFAVAVAAALIAAGGNAQAPAPAAQPAPAPVADWGDTARRDVLAAYEMFAANHPGMHDPTNPGFPAELARARDAALALAARATDRAGYAMALGAFSAELGDGHAQVFAVAPPASPADAREWPGFTVAWRGRRLLVHRAEPDSPAPAGSEIAACNGRPITDFLRTRLLTRGFRPREAGQWWFRSTQAFVSAPTTREGRPERCSFVAAGGGGTREHVLRWREAPADLDPRLAAATDGERTPIGLTEPRPGMFLVGMPDFNPDQAGADSYRALYAGLERRRPELLRARAVVLDLRHNNGGSSLWSRDVARILWGRDAVEQRMDAYFRDVAIWWRASQANTEYMDELVGRLRAQGREAQAQSTEGPAAGMRAALDRREHFYVQPLGGDSAAPAGPPPPTDFTVPVYVITPGRCASACLDALDVFTRFSGVHLIGAPTSADSTYMEVRSTLLPSGHGRIVIPNKIWIGRPRRSGEVYQPQIEVEALDWSTATFLDTIESDLAAVSG